MGLDFCELVRVRENAPDRLSRGGDGRRERRVAILKETEHFEKQLVVALPQFRGRALARISIQSPKSIQQIVNLILQRELREQPDGVGVAQALFQVG